MNTQPPAPVPEVSIPPRGASRYEVRVVPAASGAGRAHRVYVVNIVTRERHRQPNLITAMRVAERLNAAE